MELLNIRNIIHIALSDNVVYLATNQCINLNFKTDDGADDYETIPAEEYSLPTSKVS